MKSKEVIRAEIKKLRSDSRLAYPVATVKENAPLALIQLELRTKIAALRWVLKET